MDAIEINYEFPPKLVKPFNRPLGFYRYLVLHGGRGSGKSFSAAKWVAILGTLSTLRILCTREYQNTIKESFHAELKNAINSCEFLSSQYVVGIDFLRHKNNGTEFIFKGLRHNIESIKSLAQIDLCIVEEAETVPHASWQALIPTIRAENSSFIIIFNPKRRDSFVAERFLGDKLPPRSCVISMNYNDNPYFPAALEETRLDDLEVMDIALYRHVWEGAFYEQSEAQVFNGKYRVAEFEPSGDWTTLYGLDFGFANDPTAGVKIHVHDRTLYIEHELYQKHLETDVMAQELIAALPNVERHAMRADNARPETISYLKRHGLPRCEPCKKGKGSVEDGIAFMKSFKEIVIHPRCVNTLAEFDLYSYKVDRLSGEILSDIIDDNNHAIDAIRYALEPIMKQKKKSFYATRR